FSYALTHANVASTAATGTAGLDAVQTITFGGTITGGTFTLNYNNGVSINIGPITYSTDSTVLRANIQPALDAELGAANTVLPAVGNTYSGATIVNQGALQVDNSLALSNSTSTTVLDGAQL